MAVEATNTHAVWVGSLKDPIKETDLKRVFSRYGNIASCKIMRDEQGISRHFGYVNYYSEREAEAAARSMNGFLIRNVAIKTKGPSTLRQESFSPTSAIIDHRPYTDCSFGPACKNGSKCPYRHYTGGQGNPVCQLWRSKQCSDVACPNRHPGSKDGSRDSSPQVYAAVGDLISCEGRCGVLSCKAHFESQADLAFHVKLNRKLQCRHCRAIFLSEPDYLEHKELCPARLLSESTENSLSDNEQLSDQSTEEEAPIVNPQGHTTPGSEVKSKRKRRRGKRGGRRKSSNVSNGDENMLSSAAMNIGDLNLAYDTYSQYSEDSDDVEVLSEGDSTEVNRLMSLNEMDMQDSEEEGQGETSPADTVATKPTSPLLKQPRGQLEPVGVFWDIENCPVPIDKSPFALAGKIRNEFFLGKREAEFMCVCDITKERKDVMDALNKAQVTLVHVSAVAKNAADDKLRQSLRRFAHTYPPPSTVVLISGDVNFSLELKDLRYTHNITIVLLHSPQASNALKDFANTVINFDQFIKDIEAPSNRPKTVESRIVLVSNIPRGYIGRIKNRLDMLSDNCGGKVLKVDPDKGVARILYRSQESAVKSMKRMNGEDVCGSKIRTSLEPPTAYDARMQLQEMQSFSHTFPPLSRPPHPRPPISPVKFHSPRLQHRPNPPRHPGPQMMHPRMPPPPVYLPQPPPRVWMNPPANVPPLQLPPGPIPRPEGRILVYKIPQIPESEIDKLNGHVVSVRLAASIKAQHLILWHNFSELQVLLKVDFLQTTIARREEMIRALYERGELRNELSQKFLESCVADLSRVVKTKSLPWDVTLCGWSRDEEEERTVRSKVIALLRLSLPSYWTKWTNFKKRYLETYSTAISEMAVHTACRGAVQILGDSSQSQSQVIVFYELSPLLKLGTNQQVHDKLRQQFASLLHSRPEQKIKLLDFVREYVSVCGPLPAYSSGTVLQELLTSIPSVSLIGGRPSTIYVALSNPGAPPDLPTAQAPSNLAGISASFKNLLENIPNNEIPFDNFQQTYQKYYHQSFRVSDYLHGDSPSVRDLVKLCEGIRIREARGLDGRTESIVTLDTPQRVSPTPGQALPTPVPRTPPKPIPVPRQTPQPVPVPRQTPQPVPVPRQPPLQAAAGPKHDLGKLSEEFVRLIMSKPNHQLFLKNFQQEYQTFYHRTGFRVTDYISGSNPNTRQLVMACAGVTLKEAVGANGKPEPIVTLEKLPLLPNPPKASSARPGASISPAADPPRENINLFRRDCVAVLNSLPDKKCKLSNFPPEYTKLRGELFSVAKYNAKKILQLAMAIPDVVKVTGSGEGKVLELVPIDPLLQCERHIERLVYLQPSHAITLDRLMVTYQQMYGEKLEFYGHPRLLKLLESLPNQPLAFSGEGPKRKIELKPLRLFSYEISDLLADLPKGLAINAVVPSYKEKFGRDFNIAKYGVSKLIKALEAITDVIEIRGVGPSRTVHLLPSHTPSVGATSLPSAEVLVDEVTAIMVSRSATKMALSTLAKNYNESFRESQLPIATTQLADALGKIKNFKVGTTLVELVQSNSPPRNKSVSPTPPANKPTADGFHEMPALVTLDPASSPPTHRKPPVSPAKDAERLSSETKRLLLRHREHAQTLSELVEVFREFGDPAKPTVEALHQSLVRCNPGGRFQILYIESSVGDTIVQLNRKDCLFKLCLDLQYLFVYRPTSNNSLPLADLEAVYRECYGHALSCAVYGSPSVELLFDHQQIKPAIKLDQETRVCSLTDPAKHQVLTSLLSELVFVRGTQRSLLLSSLNKNFREYFGCSLEMSQYGVKKLSAIFTQIPKVAQSMTLDSGNVNVVLRIPNFVAEQIRHLLTVHNGKLSYNHLEQIHSDTFGYQDGIELKKTVKMLVPTNANIVNFAGDHKWLVWAPGGRPYSPHRSKQAPPSGSQDSATGGKSEWPVFDPVPSPYNAPSVESSVQPSPPVQSSATSSQTVDPSTVWPLFDNSTMEVPPLAITSNPLTLDSDSKAEAQLEYSGQQSNAVSAAGPASDGGSVELPLSYDELTSMIKQEKLKTNSLPEPPAVDTSPYGFLEKDLGPELMAELLSSAHSSGGNEVTQDKPDLFDYLEDDVPAPPDPALQDTFDKLLALTNSGPLPKLERKVTTQPEEPKEPFQPMDYLQAGMNPEEVLREFKKAQAQGGSILTPDINDPFLDYFGELSQQELDRIQAEERRKKAAKKGPPRKKPTMAIRFPGQSPEPAAGEDRGDLTGSSSTHISQEPSSSSDSSPSEEGVVSDHVTNSFSSANMFQGGAMAKISSLREKSDLHRPFVLTALRRGGFPPADSHAPQQEDFDVD